MTAPIRLRGIIPPMVTPLTTPSQLDTEGTRTQIQRLLAGGVHGIFVLGTTGEGPSLPDSVKRELIRLTCDEVDGRVPVLAGISDAAFAESVQMAEFCADAGVTAVTVTPPFYFQLGQEELVDYFRHLAGQSPLPLLLYDIPAMAKTHLEPATVERLMDEPKIIGIKDSSGQMIYHHELIRLARRREGFCVLIGPEELLAEAVVSGSDGGVPGGANLCPELYVAIYEAAQANDQARLALLRDRLFTLRQVYQRGPYGSSMIKGVKCALKLLGVCQEILTEPFGPFGNRQTMEIATILTSLGLLGAAGATGRAQAELGPTLACQG